jgi:glycosyltransferase involved in cell wall biosynthesis
VPGARRRRGIGSPDYRYLDLNIQTLYTNICADFLLQRARRVVRSRPAFSSVKALARMKLSKATRLLHLGKYYPPYRGGIETHLELLSRLLCQRTNLTVVVANDAPRSVRESVNGVRVERLARPLSVAGAPICPAMANAIRRANPDLVHVHLPNPGAVISYLASRHRGPVVAAWHSDVVRQRTLSALFQPILDAFLRRCAAIVVASPDYLESSPTLRQWRDKCHIIPYGISAAEYQQGDCPAERTIRERFGPRIILTVARLVPYKGVTFLIRAMRKVNGRLLIVGDGPLREALREETRSLGLEDRVVFLGSVPDTIPYYRACDVFVLPSVERSESFGLVQLEALASGKPVVNTTLPSGVPFVSPNGVTGLSVAPRDSQALADALNLLLDRPDLRSRFGREGVRRVNTEFSLEKMRDRTVRLYEHVIGGSASALSEESRRYWRGAAAAAQADAGVPLRIKGSALPDHVSGQAMQPQR